MTTITRTAARAVTTRGARLARRTTRFRDRLDAAMDRRFGFAGKVLLVYAATLTPALLVFHGLSTDTARYLWLGATALAFGGIAGLALRRQGWRTMQGLSLVVFFVVLVTELTYFSLRVSGAIPRWEPWIVQSLYCAIFVSAGVAVWYFPWTIDEQEGD